jgi:hypothetical protein
MRTILVFLLLLAAPLAQAQSPAEQAYIVARQKADADLEAKLKSASPAEQQAGGAWAVEHEWVKKALEAQLRKVIGPLPPATGLSGEGKFNGDTLCCFMGAGALDGLSFAVKHGYVVATTLGILRHWLQGKDPKEAIEQGGIEYFGALDRSANLAIVAPLSIRLPAGATTVRAGLAVECNGECHLPRHRVLAMIKGERAYIAIVKPTLPAATPLTACDAVWKEAVEK